MPITIIYQDDTYEMKEADIKKFNVIIEAKRILNPWDMVEETHKPDGAWNQIYKNGTGNHCVIPTSLIKEIG